MDRKFVLLLGIALLLIVGTTALLGLWNPPVPARSESLSKTSQFFRPLEQTYQYIKDNFYQPQRADDQQLLYGSIQGMLKQLHDPYSVFFTPEQAKKFLQGFQEKPFMGIGVYVGLSNGRLTVIKPIPGGPAEQAGVRAGDWISEIEGQSTKGITLDGASTRLRGPEGTTVKIKVQHLDGILKDIQITRAKIQVPSVEHRLMDDGKIGYIKIGAFNTPTASELRRALEAMQQSKVQGLIIDLRDNPGGFLSSAVDVASFFVDRGLILTERTRQGSQSFPSHGNRFPNWPLAVLINRNTASSAEILSGALRDHEMAILIGEKTFGKGIVQTTQELGDGSLLKLTTGEYHTPLGRKVQGVGLPADIKVPQPDEPLAKLLGRLHQFGALFPSDDSKDRQLLSRLRRQANEIQIQVENDRFEAALQAARAMQGQLERERAALQADGGLIAQGELDKLSGLLKQLSAALERNDFSVATAWLKAHFGQFCPCRLPPLPQPQTPSQHS